MAVTVSTGTHAGRDGLNALAARYTSIVRVTFDSSYPTGGEPFDPKKYVGFTPAVVLVIPRYSSGATGAAGRVFEYDHTNKKIVAFQQKDPAAAGGADIQLPEVANTTDLSGVVVDVVIIGV